MRKIKMKIKCNSYDKHKCNSCDCIYADHADEKGIFSCTEERWKGWVRWYSNGTNSFTWKCGRWISVTWTEYSFEEIMKEIIKTKGGEKNE